VFREYKKASISQRRNVERREVSTLSFFGAAGTVTGSCALLEANGAKYLVDCGLFQGNKTLAALNGQPFPFDASNVDCLLLTHAHTDHSGLIPKLLSSGFEGPILATEPTVDLLQFMLADSAKIQEAEAERRNRRKLRQGKPIAPPIFTMEDAEAALKRLKVVDYETWVEPLEGFQVRFWNAGHILGSASIEVKYLEPQTEHTMRILFSGDLGPDEKAFHPDPNAERGFDYVVCESTYGNRDRPPYTLAERRAVLRRELTEGLERGGNIIIPSFAVERSQELLHDIGTLLARNEIPRAAVFLDSPLARKATEVFVKHANLLDEIEIPEEKLFRDRRFHIVQSVAESKEINRLKGGAIIISASGMADAGRVQHHLKNNIWRREATILFVGYQAPGTLGQIIQDGAPEVRIHGKEFRVHAQIRSISNYSAHADQAELIDWIMERSPIVGGLFLDHGENVAREALRERLIDRGMEPRKILLPDFDESFELKAGAAASKGRGPARIAEDQLHRDWYNDYAAFAIALGDRLEAEGDPQKCREIIRNVRAALERK
jgi:metallo-beta-lactamase family protein